MLLTVGSACVAQYGVDGCFYRGEIVSLDCTGGDGDDGVRAGVRFVDYGSFEFVPQHRSSSRLTYRQLFRPRSFFFFRCVGLSLKIGVTNSHNVFI